MQTDTAQTMQQTQAPAPERPAKPCSASATETTRILQYRDINGENRLFGGKLMEWIDEAATITAMRHCECHVTTACVDTLVFKKGAYLNDLVVVAARVTYVGTTSMEVRVDSYVEDSATGLRHMINHAYLTVVCVDEDGKPKQIPYDLKIEGEEEQIEYEGAMRRREMRRERREEGY